MYAFFILLVCELSFARSMAIIPVSQTNFGNEVHAFNYDKAALQVRTEIPTCSTNEYTR